MQLQVFREDDEVLLPLKERVQLQWISDGILLVQLFILDAEYIQVAAESGLEVVNVHLSSNVVQGFQAQARSGPSGLALLALQLPLVGSLPSFWRRAARDLALP
jgi:hypothetical protein